MRPPTPSAHPCDTPTRDVTSWVEVQLSARWMVRLPPWLEPRELDVVDTTGTHLILWAGTRDANGQPSASAWMAVWLDRSPGYSIGVYPPERQAKVVEREECVVAIGDATMHIVAWRTLTVNEPPMYDVSAWLPALEGRWVRLGMQAPSREQQEDVIAALRTIRPSDKN